MKFVFVDTGTWFALFSRRDINHSKAVDWIQQNRDRLITTDYVLDELFTLLKVRENSAFANKIAYDFTHNQDVQIEFITPADFELTCQVFHNYQDKDWSFTDCTSKVVMERLGIEVAFAFDHHFEQFGTVKKVPIVT